MKILIRAAKISDAADLTRLSKVLGYPVSEKLLLTNLSNALKEQENLLFVAETEGAVHGFIQGEHYAPLYFDRLVNVLGLVVGVAFQDLGLGGRLLEQLEQVARARGYSGVRINSGSHRQLAHQFYEKQGYRSSHEQKTFRKEFK